MQVSDLMNRNPMIVKSDSPVQEVWKIIFDKRISGLPVVGKNNLLLGIISEEDLIEELYPSYEDYFFDPQYARNFEEMEKNLKDISHLKASDIMNRDIYTIEEDAPIMKAAASMLVYKVSCLPVVENVSSNKKLVGIICKGDIFSELFLKVTTKKK